MGIFVVVSWSLRRIHAPFMVDKVQLSPACLYCNSERREGTPTPGLASEVGCSSDDFPTSQSLMWTSYNPDWSWVKSWFHLCCQDEHIFKSMVGLPNKCRRRCLKYIMAGANTANLAVHPCTVFPDSHAKRSKYPALLIQKDLCNPTTEAFYQTSLF
jgi:hypothetical protein